MNVLQTRNLTCFRRHLPVDCLHDDFVADFGFRAEGSQFSILREPTGDPGPDELFAHVQMDARRLFEKLLGLEVTFPGGSFWPYTSTNHYRSHLHEFFHWTAGQHQVAPPVAGECRMFFAGHNDLVIEYRLRNTSAASVPLRVAFRSRPALGKGVRRQVAATRFGFSAEQAVSSSYRAALRLTGDAGRWQWRAGEFRSAPVALRLRAHEERTWTFRCTFAAGMTKRGKGAWLAALAMDRTLGQESTPRERCGTAACTAPLLRCDGSAATTIAATIRRANRFFESLPPLTGEARRFEPLVLRAAGILYANRYRDLDRRGRPVMTIHAGKTGVEATWWWDGAIHLLGLGLCRDRETIRGAVHLLLDGLAADGAPVVRYGNGQYHVGAQMPILAWGLWHAQADCPDPALVRRVYPRLGRYVRWWLNRRGASGLVTLPGGCTAQDDSPRWSPHFPIAWEKGSRWDTKTWGHSHPSDFECPDVNAHLYLELRALEQMAHAQGRAADAAEWSRLATTLGQAINRFLFDPVTGSYQDRHIASGKFTGYLTAGCFVPLYAGLMPRRHAVQACRRYLLDPERFYTTLPFAGVDRAHPAFKSGGTLYEVPQFPGARLQSAYWLGRVWLQYSYWLTGALWQAGLKREADAAADKVLEALLPQESLYECYDPLTAAGNGHAEFSWGAAAALAFAYRRYARPAWHHARRRRA